MTCTNWSATGPGQDGSDTYDQLKAVEHLYPKTSLLAVATALSGDPAEARKHFG
jgi:hypothetical protein